MEDIYSVKVKTRADNRAVYPSERRYSASTVSGLAWVHLALAATSLLLACLALVNPNSRDPKAATPDPPADNSTDLIVAGNNDYSYILVVAPSLMAVFALGAGLAAIMASARWYIDRNIAILFFISVLSSVCSLAALIAVAAWYNSTGSVADFYTDKTPFKDYFVVRHSDVLVKNETHLVINSKRDDAEPVFNKSVLSINILIAAFLEFLWSVLSSKIAYTGMKTEYKDDCVEPKADSVTVVTKVRGSGLQARPDLINHYPKKMEKMFLSNDDRFYLKYLTDRDERQNTDTGSEFYTERIAGFLDRYAEESVLTESAHQPPDHLIPIREVTPTEIESAIRASWGDTPDHTVYNQDTINFDSIFKLCEKNTSKNDEECEENE